MDNRKDKTTMFRGIVRKMMDDRRSIREYIKENGTIDGYNSESVRFAKPLK